MKRILSLILIFIITNISYIVFSQEKMAWNEMDRNKFYERHKEPSELNIDKSKKEILMINFITANHESHLLSIFMQIVIMMDNIQNIDQKEKIFSGKIRLKIIGSEKKVMEYEFVELSNDICLKLLSKLKKSEIYSLPFLIDRGDFPFEPLISRKIGITYLFDIKTIDNQISVQRAEGQSLICDELSTHFSELAMKIFKINPEDLATVRNQ